MTLLLMGLVLFLGSHSVRIFAEGWRAATVARIGENRWKAIYSLVALAGFALLAWGYGSARMAPIVLWVPPLFTRHLAALLTLPAFVLLAAAYVPGNGLKARLRHPMVLGVKLWAFAHLLANGNLADVLLFGSFLVWAMFDYRAARQRDRAAAATAGGAPVKTGHLAATIATVVVGVVAWVAFAFWGHALLIGVRPF